jgi:hypothetical protein
MQAQPAPIERSAPEGNGSAPYLQSTLAPSDGSMNSDNGSGNQGYGYNNDNQHAHNRGVMTSQPIQGVWLHVAPGSSVQTVSANADGVELRVEKGVADVIVQHPADNVQILVDLPGGQTSLIKDGTYTFNAATNTIRVLGGGEADAYAGTAANAKGITIKNDEELALGASSHAREADPGEQRADLLAGGNGGPGNGYRGDGYAEYAGAYAPYYGYGYGYPYYYGYPYGYDYGFGYPFGVGLGFGYYGGFGGYYGGFHGGYGGGFHGGGFGGHHGR